LNSSKLPETGVTIFSVMSQLATEHGAINLGQGFPGFPIDPELSDAVSKAMRDGHNQYAPMPGVLSLRQRLSEKMHTLYGVEWNPQTEITITAGATQALFTAITALIHPGDEVILFAPAYDCYAPAVQLNGGIPVWIELSAPDYHIPWDEVEARITPRTRMILTNSPHNPAATVLNREDLLRLEALTRYTSIIVLSDEVYEHIVFDGARHESVFRYPELAARSLAVFSFGKTFHATGWKMGYIVGPEEYMTEFRKVHQYTVFSCNTPVQVALAEYLQTPSHYTEIHSFYQKKRDLFLSHLAGSRFNWKPASGTYFQLLDYSPISQENDVVLAQEWTLRYGIASIPASVFYPTSRDQHVLRFCFAKEDELLVQAAEILRSI